MKNLIKPQFQAGGALLESSFYVQRPADHELFQTLLKGEYCYVLAPKQIGKSSLRLRTENSLKQQGVLCASVDLQRIGINDVSAESWFYSSLRQITQELPWAINLSDFWEKNNDLTAVERWQIFFEQEVLSRTDKPFVVFVDEVDLFLLLDFSDDFFSIVRAMSNDRASNPIFERLTFCLLGTASPNELIKNKTRIAFNIGTSIPLEDFTKDEARAFLPGLEGLGGNAQAFLNSILQWTDGHPYMTQKICEALIEKRLCNENTKTEKELVDNTVNALFFEPVNGHNSVDENLLYAENHFEKDNITEKSSLMLQLYKRLWTREQVPFERNDHIQLALRLTGMAALRKGTGGNCLKVRNEIFAKYFNQDWIRKIEANRYLTAPLRIWLDAGRKDDSVLRGAALEEALMWSESRGDLTNDEMKFLTASKRVADAEKMERQQAKDRDRYIRRLRLGAIGLSLLSIFLIAVSIYAWNVSKRLKEEVKAKINSFNNLEKAQGDLTQVTINLREAEEREEIINNRLKTTKSIIKEKEGIIRKKEDLIKEMEPKVNEAIKIKNELATLKPELINARNEIKNKDTKVKELADKAQKANDIFNKASEDLTAAQINLQIANETINVLKSQKQQLEGERNKTLQETELAIQEFKQKIADQQKELSRINDLINTAKTELANEVEKKIQSPDPKDFTQGIILAADAVRLNPSPEALNLFKNGLDLLPSVLMPANISYEGPVQSIASSSNNEYLATTGKSRVLSIRNYLSQKETDQLRFSEDIIKVASSLDGIYFATLRKKNIDLWGWADHKAIKKELIPSRNARDEVMAVAFSAKGEYIAAAIKNQKPKIWATASGTEIPLGQNLPQLSDSSGVVAISSEGNSLAIAFDKSAKIYDWTTGQLKYEKSHGASINSTAFSPDGKYFVTAGEDGIAKIWPLSNQQEPVTVSHADKLTAITFSPNGKFLATASEDNSARIWESSTGHQIFRIPYAHTVYTLTFSPDSRYLIVGDKGDKNGHVRIWDISRSVLDKGKLANFDAEQLLTTACQRLLTELEQYSRLNCPKVETPKPLREKDVLPENDPNASIRIKLISNLFDKNKNTRQDAVATLSREWLEDEKLVPELLAYAYQNKDNSKGIINVLFLIEKVAPQTLKKHQEKLTDFFATVEGNGSETRSDIQKIRKRLNP
jgi:WD40 repeat protein